MNRENKKEKAGEKQTIRQRLLSWLGFLAVAATMLFFFAPESWWQFGGYATLSEAEISSRIEELEREWDIEL